MLLMAIRAMRILKREPYDLCILDIMMPYKDGFTLAEEVRDLNKEIPIIFLTAKTLKEDVLKGYQIGADDYITKPFDSEVLLYKIKAILQRSVGDKKPDEHGVFSIGDYEFDSKLRTLSYNKEEAKKLSPKEARLLHLLCIKINDLLSRQEALSKIWKEDNYFTSRSMDVYITKLRKYLERDPRLEINNVHGEGFRLVFSKD